MTRRLIAFAFASAAMMGGLLAAELAASSGHSIHLVRFDGVIYYTVEQDGYRVVATLASGADELPIRFVSTLGPGQRIVISVPQALGRPSIDFEILRNGDALLVSDPISAAAVEPADEVLTPAATGQ